MAGAYLLPLKDRHEVAEGTMAFWFDTSGADFSFKPGQYANFTLPEPLGGSPDDASHVFSLASSPHHKDFVMIATRMRSSAFKNALKDLSLGTKLKVQRPAGRFTLHEDHKIPAVLIAGGIGITPMRSMIEWATEKKSSPKLYLFYSNRIPQSTAFMEDLEKWGRQNPNFKLIATLTDSDDPTWKHEKGPIDAEMIERHVPELDRSIFYVVGPPGMVDGMDKTLEGMGIERERVRVEKFDGY
jgi:ferredoxin-NADP reductase